ncbi:acyl-CoA hydrolase [Aureococcus anophagefferens]|uniref:Acyl-CoA hydrolase n=1 Tax=Aureococcus anophagefferens TaxID=44056 RepID=A0ABR1G990_AURAN
MTLPLARFGRLGARTTRRFSGADASLGARTTRRFSGGGASLHRSAITQHLWALRDGAFAPPPPRADGSRVPAHSRVCVDYKLTSDAELRSRYESAFGTLRGPLLEDMDALGPRRARRGRRAAARAPDDDDGAAVDALLGPGRVARDFPGQADDGCVPMASTSLRNALMCHPQERNTAGRVFGGVLMRRALELAFATAFSYGGAAPLTKALDRVDFVRPVDVGSLLALKSHVVFAEGTTMHVDVSAAVWRPDKRESTLTNTFSFVFTVDGPRPLKRVLPSTRAEARLQLAAMARATET